jgi:hypothetical protein
MVGVGGSFRFVRITPTTNLKKRIRLVLANSLIHYLSSSLQAEIAVLWSDKSWTDPIITTPQELRDHPTGPIFFFSGEKTQGNRPTITHANKLACRVRVGEGPLTMIFVHS